MEIVARTDMVALVPRRIAVLAEQRGDVVILNAISANPSFGLSMFWHSKQRSDAGLAWLREKILQSMQDRAGE